jgi:hypothetical protein
MTRVFDLDSIEAELCKCFDALTASFLARVRPDRNRSGSVRERNRFSDLESRLGNEPRLACAKKTVERFA